MTAEEFYRKWIRENPKGWDALKFAEAYAEQVWKKHNIVEETMQKAIKELGQENKELKLDIKKLGFEYRSLKAKFDRLEKDAEEMRKTIEFYT